MGYQKLGEDPSNKYSESTGIGAVLAHYTTYNFQQEILRVLKLLISKIRTCRMLKIILALRLIRRSTTNSHRLLLGGAELTYREERSTESFVMRNLPRERSAVNSHFEPLKIHVTETKSAPECVASEKSYNETSRHLHEPSLLNFETNARTETSQESVRAYFHNNTGNYNQHFAPRSDTGTVSVESVISSTPSDHQVVPEKNGNGVMKKIESSILSFFGFGSTKESSMRQTNKSQSSTGPTSDRIMSFFSYQSAKGTNKWDFPTNTATEEIDYSIYGSHAKYYM